jgi:uncharacterized protein (UPF0333 family)
MSIIPTKSQLAQAAAARAEAAAAHAAAAAKQQIADSIKFYTEAIVAQMVEGGNSYSCNTRYVSPEVERRLRTDFAAQGWTLEFHRPGIGCWISWS